MYYDHARLIMKRSCVSCLHFIRIIARRVLKSFMLGVRKEEILIDYHYESLVIKTVVAHKG